MNILYASQYRHFPLMSYIIQFIATAIALYFTARYVPGIQYTSSSALIVFVIVLTILNVVLGTALRIVTFPVKILTLGLSSFLISVLMVYIASRYVTGISLDNPITVAIVAVVTSAIAMVFRVFR